MSRKILSLTAVLLTFALLFGFAGCSLIPEGEEETTTEINVKTPLPTEVTSSVDEDGNTVTQTEYSPEQLAANTAEIFEYFNKVINEVKTKQAAVRKTDRYYVGRTEDADGNRLPYCENEFINAAFSGLKSKYESTKTSEIDYGTKFAESIPVKDKPYVSRLDAADIESATCVDDGAERTVTVVLKEPVSQTALLKAFETADVEYLIKEFKKTEQYIAVGEPEITYTACSITIKVNIETDEVTQIRYQKTADVTVPVTGAGSLESVGEQTVNFSTHPEIIYDFDYNDPNEPTEL